MMLLYRLCFLKAFWFVVSLSSLHAQILNEDSLINTVEQIGEYLWHRNHDSTYIRSYSDRLAVKLIVVNKYNFFQIRDKNSSSTITYRPELGLNLGVGVAYRWFSLDVAFNFGIKESLIPDSKFFDFQGTLFSSNQFVEATLQYYLGYQVFNTNGLAKPLPEMANIRPDILTINLRLQYLYALDYDKFSIKAPFVFTEAQRRNAGSPMLGVAFSLFTLGADSSIVPLSARADFNPKLYLEDLWSIGLSVSLGYMYSFVVKERFFLTLSLIPGVRVTAGDYRTDRRQSFPLNVSLKVKTLNAVGYNGDRWFGGLQFTSDISNIRIAKKLVVPVGSGFSKFFLGYRLGRRKKR